VLRTTVEEVINVHVDTWATYVYVHKGLKSCALKMEDYYLFKILKLDFLVTKHRV